MNKPFNVIVDTRHGKMIVNENDQYVAQSLIQYGEYSPAERRFFDQIIQPGWYVFDCGANHGAHTVQFAELVGPTGIVFAFEPQRLIYQALCGNVALGSHINVHAFNAGVGAEQGVIGVLNLSPYHQNNFGGLELGGTDDATHDTVPLMTLDAFAGLGHVEFIKVDVEGMERDVLLGGKQMIANHRPLMYVENNRKDKGEALLATIAELGYEAITHLPPLFDPDNFNGKKENVLGDGVVSSNVFCVPKEKVSQYVEVVEEAVA